MRTSIPDAWLALTVNERKAICLIAAIALIGLVARYGRRSAAATTPPPAPPPAGVPSR